MRPLLYVLSFLAVLGLGFWAYRENYTTQGALREVADLQDEIATLHESLAIQRAEWAYLNRPDRLRDLAVLNFDRLGLMPMEPHQFGHAIDIAYPPPPSLADGVSGLGIDDPVDTSGVLNADPEEGTTP
ncbi:MAG: cell division protein FtsL [Rhodobacteraceae bacterium]|jgi:hypothetical protein|nr:cell division protein FtsL [Paracoccaceae bacterium]